MYITPPSSATWLRPALSLIDNLAASLNKTFGKGNRKRQYFGKLDKISRQDLRANERKWPARLPAAGTFSAFFGVDHYIYVQQNKNPREKSSV
jgi:hypothetical protein